MDKKNIVQQGTVVKMSVTFTRDGFDPSADDFSVCLSWGHRGQHMIIKKNMMEPVKDGRWLLMYDTSEMIGAVTASTRMCVSDTDTDSGTLHEIDRQVVAFVVATPNPRVILCGVGEEDDHAVLFEMVTEGGLTDKYRYLRDGMGRRLITGGEEYVLVLGEREDV